jgi:tetratricopeptide (TPR) repeat protein
MFLIAPFAGALARILCGAFAAGMLLLGCAQQPAARPGDQALQAAASSKTDADDDEEERPAPPARRAAAEAQAKLPSQELTQAILYEFLLAEVAGQRGSAEVAARAYADLARQTRDPRIARRATEIAIFARINTLAVESARIWRETDPRSQRALQILTGLLVNAGRLEEAEPQLKELLSSEGANVANAFAQLGRTLGSAQDKEAALRVMQKLADGYSQVPQAHYAIAQVAANAGHGDVALKEVRTARDLRPDWDAAVLLEAQLLQKTSGEDALGSLAGYLQKYPKSREVRLSYARMLVAEKRFAGARGEFQKLLADFPGNTDVVYAVALLSVQLNDYPLAEENLRRLLEMDYRDKSGIRLYLGQIAEEQNKYGDALKWYASVAEGEQFIQAQIRYAQVLSKQGKLPEARAHLQRLEASGGQQRVQLILAEAQLLRDASREKEAFEFVGKALDAEPEQPELLYDYAMLAERVDRIDLLESSLRKLIKIRPDYAHAYNALGYSLAERNMRLAEARELIEQALKLAPDDSFIVDSMGWVLYRMGNLPEALSWLRKAFAERPDPEIAAHLGEVLWVTGDRGEAEKVWLEGSEKNPKNEILTKTIQRLKQ